MPQDKKIYKAINSALRRKLALSQNENHPLQEKESTSLTTYNAISNTKEKIHLKEEITHCKESSLDIKLFLAGTLK